jgi:hypothetical protein
MPFTQQVSDATVYAMCCRYTAGENITEIAKQTGFDRTTVHYWLRKRGIHRRSNSQAKRRYRLREDAFAVISDEHAAYWLGFLFADGSVSVRRAGKEKSVRLLLQASDQRHLQAFADFIGTDKPIRIIRNGEGTACEVTAYSSPLVDDLMRHGCIPNKSAVVILKVPSLPCYLQRHFVRGVFDGDGAVFVGDDGAPNLNLCGKPAFLDTIRELILWHTGISGIVRGHTVSRAIEYLVYRGPRKATPVGRWLYQEASIALDRKKGAIASFTAPKHYAGTVGHVSEPTVRKYIASQKGK